MAAVTPSTEPDTAQRRWDELSGWGREPQLNELDALMWRTEVHPTDSWTGAVVELLDVTPDWDRYRLGAERMLGLVPRLRERVVEPLLPVGPPVWETDPHFDFDYHMRRVRLPEPGSMAQLLELTQALALAPLDRNRPPWVRTMVEGLEGGRAASILQAQHVLMDGMAYAQLMARMYRAERDEPTPVPLVTPRARTAPGPARLTLDQLAQRMLEGPGFTWRALGMASRALTRPARTLRYADSLRRVLAPPPATTSPLLGTGARTAWRFGTLECGLDELKRAGRAGGGSVNDAFAAALLGGLRRYHERLGITLGDIPISMPVSMRRPEDAMEGNRFAGAFFAAPAGMADAERRIEAMRARVDEVRGEPALDFLGILTPVLNRAPAAAVGAALRSLNARVDLTLSNWPGVPEPVYVAGARVERMFVFGPLPGTAMCAALNSHAGTCCIGLNVDGDVFEDTGALWDCMAEGLDEVLALGRAGG